mmetsp:Transcript_7432/g.23066  ORF Transcript_7432/g.23066 Transcript_7432/m.23066 type:complete len:311 (-) Transcript_7432:66-998(-)
MGPALSRSRPLVLPDGHGRHEHPGPGDGHHPGGPGAAVRARRRQLRRQVRQELVGDGAQGLRLLRRALRLLRHAPGRHLPHPGRHRQRQGLAAGNFPDIGVRAERVRRKLRGKVDLMKKLARVAEAASMFFASRVLVELASEVEGFIAATSETKTTSGSPTAGQVYGAPADGAGSPSKAAPRGLKQARDRQRLAADQRRFKFCFWSVVRLVLLESVPSLSLTVAFFSLQFHRLGPLGQAKTVLSTCCSAASALSMGLYAYSGGLKGKIVAALVVLFVLLPLVKMVFAFVCDSNFFSAMTFRCVEPVEAEA